MSMAMTMLGTFGYGDFKFKSLAEILAEKKKNLIDIDKLDHESATKVLMGLSVLELLKMEEAFPNWKEEIQRSFDNIKKIDCKELLTMIPLRKYEDDEVLKEILIRCNQHLTHLTLGDSCYSWMSTVLKNNFQNVTHFTMDFGWHGIPSKDLLEIILAMPKLKVLKLSNIACDLRTDLLQLLPSSMEEIHFHAQYYECHYPLRYEPALLDRFNGLRCLTLQAFYMSNAIKNLILQNKDTLVYLDLFKSYFPNDALSIFKDLYNLEHLDLILARNFKADEVIEIAHSCSQLKHFAFGIPHLSHRIFQELRYLKYLEHLEFYNVFIDNKPAEDDFYDVDDKCLISPIANHCKRLKCLYLKKGSRLPRSDLQQIGKFKYLEHAYLGEESVDSQIFINIVDNCLDLKYLDVDMTNLSETAIEKIPNLKKLECLIFWNGCNSLNGDILTEIANCCTNLKQLNISKCCNITEASLIHVGKLQHLEYLQMNNVNNVPVAMFNDFNKLKKLCCSNCPTVIDEGIINVIDNCQHLSELKIDGTGVTLETIIHAKEYGHKFKQLKITADECLSKYYNDRRNWISGPAMKVDFPDKSDNNRVNH